MNSGTIDGGYAIILASHFSEEWTLLHSRGFHWPRSQNMGSSDIAKTMRRVASIALLLSYTSSATQSTWLEKRDLRLPVHGPCTDEQ